jgi:hypothetical protein
MKEEASKSLYVTPIIGILRFYNEGAICQSGNVVINPDYDDEIEFPIPLS